MTHEFKTPIATINLALDAIKNPKIILVTDRVDLDDQITETFQKCHVPVVNADKGTSKEIAKKMSQMLGTSVEVWLELQKKYEDKCCQIEQLKELERERKKLEIKDQKKLEKTK